MNNFPKTRLGNPVCRISLGVFIAILLTAAVCAIRPQAARAGARGDLTPGWKVFTGHDMSVAAPEDWYVEFDDDMRAVMLTPTRFFQSVLIVVQDANEQSQAVLAKQRSDGLQSTRPVKVGFWHQYDFAEETALSRTIMFKRNGKILAYKRSGDVDQIPDLPLVLSTLESSRADERAMLDIFKKEVLPAAEKFIPVEHPYMIFEADTRVETPLVAVIVPGGWLWRHMQVAPFERVIYSPDMDLRLSLCFYQNDLSLVEQAAYFSISAEGKKPENYGPTLTWGKDENGMRNYFYLFGAGDGKKMLFMIWGDLHKNSTMVKEIIAGLEAGEEGARSMVEELKSLPLIGIQ